MIAAKKEVMEDELMAMLQDKMMDYDAEYIKETYERLKALKTVEEVEKARCNSCSSNSHYGWCDQSNIICYFKYRIKQILGIPLNENSVSFEDDFKRILEEA